MGDFSTRPGQKNQPPVIESLVIMFVKEESICPGWESS